jgi:hypothetical protein
MKETERVHFDARGEVAGESHLDRYSDQTVCNLIFLPITSW